MKEPPELTFEDRKDFAAIIEATCRRKIESACRRKAWNSSTVHCVVDRFVRLVVYRFVRDVEESMATYLRDTDQLPSLRTAFPSDIDIGERRKVAKKLYNAARSAAREWGKHRNPRPTADGKPPRTPAVARKFGRLWDKLDALGRSNHRDYFERHAREIQFGVPPDRSLFEWAEAHFEKWSGGSYKDWHATNWRTAKAQRRRTGDLLENPPLCVVKVVFVLTSSGLEPADVGEVMPVRFKPIIEPHPRAKKGGGQRDDALLLLVMSLAIDYSNATGRKPGRTGTEDHHFETLVRRVWERLGLANADGEPGSTYYVRRYLKTMNHPIPIV